MKLLMISGDRSTLTGKQGAFYNMLEEFATHWDRIDVITPRPYAAMNRVTSGSSSNVCLFGKVYFHPSSRSLWYQPKWIYRKGLELLAQHKHDVMTVHEYPPFYNGRGARWLSKKTGVPYVSEIHHIVGYPRAASLAEWLGKLMTRLLLRRVVRPAAKVRVVNRTVQRLLWALGIPESKVAVVPSFYLDRQILKPIEKLEKQYDLAFCGRLVKNKGLLDIIDILPAFSKVTLLVIGDGSLKKVAEDHVHKLGLFDRVVFTSWLPTQSDVARAIQTARVFVMPSRSEGGPRVALEAMACGMPVLTTRVGIMPDVIQDGYNGIFINGQKEDLVQKIDHLLHDPPLRKMLGTNAREIINQFEKKQLIAEYADFLQLVVSEHKKISGEELSKIAEAQKQARDAARKQQMQAQAQEQASAPAIGGSMSATGGTPAMAASPNQSLPPDVPVQSVSASTSAASPDIHLPDDIPRMTVKAGEQPKGPGQGI